MQPQREAATNLKVVQRSQKRKTDLVVCFLSLLHELKGEPPCSTLRSLRGVAQNVIFSNLQAGDTEQRVNSNASKCPKNLQRHGPFAPVGLLFCCRA